MRLSVDRVHVWDTDLSWAFVVFDRDSHFLVIIEVSRQWASERAVKANVAPKTWAGREAYRLGGDMIAATLQKEDTA